jgi:hypothetical protein
VIDLEATKLIKEEENDEIYGDPLQTS